MTTKSGIHIARVWAENFHRLRFAAVEYVPGTGLVRVTGKNGAGKTSLLRAVASALGGAGEVLPAAVNEESEDGTGKVRVELTNGYTITRRFTEKAPKGYLTVEGPDGGKHSQAKVGEWLGARSFDPLALFDVRPNRLAEILLGLGNDPQLATQLDALRARQKQLYDERTPYISAQRHARAVPKPEGQRPEPVDVSSEMARLAELQAIERRQQDEGRALLDKQREIEAAGAACKRMEDRVAELEAKLAEARSALATSNRTKQRLLGEQMVMELAYETRESVTDEIEEVTARISEADAINARLEPWKRFDDAQSELREATTNVARLTDAMRELKDTEHRLIAEAGIPVEGLSFDEDGAPLLRGKPLAVASGAERIRMAVAVALAANPGLRVCLLDEANDLDLEMLDELRLLAEEHDFQVWACRIGLEGAGEIVVEDGEARSAEPTVSAS